LLEGAGVAQATGGQSGCDNLPPNKKRQADACRVTRRPDV